MPTHASFFFIFLLSFTCIKITLLNTFVGLKVPAREKGLQKPATRIQQTIHACFGPARRVEYAEYRISSLELRSCISQFAIFGTGTS